MQIGVIGTGYVGLVVGACLAETGHDVTCVDIDERKVEMLRRGHVPIFEPGLEELVTRNLLEQRLRFTTELAQAVQEASVIFIAVGTPSDTDGSADLRYVLDVATQIGKAMNGEKIVITKSTVPVGTADKVRRAIRAETQHVVHVCSNPEFLKEGAAVNDFMKPDRVILGVDSDHAADVLRDLYSPFVRTGNEIVLMDVPSAEITKYAANAMLATRVSFMNLIARLCEKTGANVDSVRLGVGSDERIGRAFLFPGVGYGGSCFPKDVVALAKTAEELGESAGLLRAVDDINERQKSLLSQRILARLGDDLWGRTVAVWGLAFKPNTNDMRKAPSLVTVKTLIEKGATVRVHDPEALEEARTHFGDSVEYCEQSYDALPGADALVIHTEWHPYRRPDFERIKREMKAPLIFDGRNLYQPERMLELGFEYHSVGRRPVGVKSRAVRV